VVERPRPVGADTRDCHVMRKGQRRTCGAVFLGQGELEKNREVRERDGFGKMVVWWERDAV